jgi:ubiquinone/menaquinone biosynthesis C-methylase UbiE
MLPDDAQAKAASTYNSESDHYDDDANSFWARFGRRTIERLTLRRGARVLDVCCGSGASAIESAMTVGESGSVIGVDLAENLLALARVKARRHGLTNVEFSLGDMQELALPQQTFDAVVCVFGIFFHAHSNSFRL